MTMQLTINQPGAVAYLVTVKQQDSAGTLSTDDDTVVSCTQFSEEDAPVIELAEGMYVVIDPVGEDE
jgi:hypothetical protein